MKNLSKEFHITEPCLTGQGDWTIQLMIARHDEESIIAYGWVAMWDDSLPVVSVSFHEEQASIWLQILYTAFVALDSRESYFQQTGLAWLIGSPKAPTSAIIGSVRDYGALQVYVDWNRKPLGSEIMIYPHDDQQSRQVAKFDKAGIAHLAQITELGFKELGWRLPTESTHQINEVTGRPIAHNDIIETIAAVRASATKPLTMEHSDIVEAVGSNELLIGADPAVARRFFTMSNGKDIESQIGEPIFGQQLIIKFLLYFQSLLLLAVIILGLVAFSWLGLVIGIAFIFCWFLYSGQASIGRYGLGKVWGFAAVCFLVAFFLKSFHLSVILWVILLPIPFLFAGLLYRFSTIYICNLALRNKRAFDLLYGSIVSLKKAE